MSKIDIASLDRNRIRELFDLRSNTNLIAGGDYTDDPYPIWHDLRASATVHPGTVHELTGYDGTPSFHGLPFPDRPHFSTFSYAACDAAYRDDKVFASSPDAADDPSAEVGYEQSMLMMGGTKHRRYRSLVQPSFVPAKAQWWISQWIDETVQALIDSIVDDGRAELNVDFCASIPVLTITGSFGIPVEQALDVRAALRDPMALVGRARADRRRPTREPPGRPDQRAGRGRADRRGRQPSPASPTPRSTRSRCSCCWPDRARRGSRWASRSPRCSQRPGLLDAVRQDRQLLEGCDRGVAPVDADRPDVLPLGRRGRRLLRHAPAQGIGAAPLHRCRQPRPRAVGPARRVRPVPSR